MQLDPERLKKIRSYLILLIPLLLLIPGMGGFPYPAVDALYSDMAISHFPNAVFLRQSLLSGEFPLWADTILSGYPFAANPLSSIWYLPHYFALLFPLPFGLNLLTVLHLYFAGVGLLHYLRKQGLSEYAALFGAVAFVSMPKLFAHFGAGHLTLLYAIPWTPWLLLAIESQRDRWFKQPALMLAIIFLADPRWAAYAGLLWLGWEIAYGQNDWLKRTFKFGFQLFLTMLIAAPLAFPLLNYTRLSTRIHMTPQDVLSFSLSPANFLGVLFPNFGSGQEELVYFGNFALVLVLVVVLMKAKGKATFWLWVAGLSMLYSLGENIPGMLWIAKLPGLSLLRVPSRALFLTGISFAVLSAYAVDMLSTLVDEKIRKRIRLTLMAITTFSAALAVIIMVLSGEGNLVFIWGVGTLMLAWLIIEIWFARRIQFGTFFFVFLLCATLDWGMINQSLFAYQAREVVLAQGAEAAAWLADQPGEFRVYSPSYSIPQQTAALYGLHLADGVDPLQLEAYAAYMEDATGVPRRGYSVTLPAFEGADEDGSIAQTNRAYLPDIELLSALNVRYIVAAFEIPLGLPVATQLGETYIYELPITPAEQQVEFEYGRFAEMLNLGLIGFVLGVLGLIWTARRQRAR